MDTLVKNASAIAGCRPCAPNGFCTESADGFYSCLYEVSANMSQPLFDSIVTAEPLDCERSTIIIVCLFTTLVALLLGCAIGILIGRRRNHKHSFPWEKITSSSSGSFDSEIFRQVNADQMKREERRLFGYSRTLDDYEEEMETTTTKEKSRTIQKYMSQVSPAPSTSPPPASVLSNNDEQEIDVISSSEDVKMVEESLALELEKVSQMEKDADDNVEMKDEEEIDSEQSSFKSIELN
ncbi:hypothetical protein CAEBREN_18100 [Caenorhabditis brenneri]|uniref:Uncharacterized protein n=1 Tax=Caenorhabditis brenneri TaxID=135651 RepID=G0PLA1_CAEBE|nr:hypothetical protein CAEBREN_18100 [Caenorhabditis brenneri]